MASGTEKLLSGWNTKKEKNEFTKMLNFILDELIHENNEVMEDNVDLDDDLMDDISTDSESSLGNLTQKVIDYGEEILFKDNKEESIVYGAGLKIDDLSQVDGDDIIADFQF
jgi:hypothetical protein